MRGAVAPPLVPALRERVRARGQPPSPPCRVLPARPAGSRCRGRVGPARGFTCGRAGRGGHRRRSCFPLRGRRRRHPVASRGGGAERRQGRLSPGGGSAPAGQAARRLRIPAPGAAVGPGARGPARGLREVGAGPASRCPGSEAERGKGWLGEGAVTPLLTGARHVCFPPALRLRHGWPGCGCCE